MTLSLVAGLWPASDPPSAWYSACPLSTLVLPVSGTARPSPPSAATAPMTLLLLLLLLLLLPPSAATAPTTLLLLLLLPASGTPRP